MRIVIHYDKDKAITIGQYFQQLFKHKHHINIQWENEINTKIQEHINQVFISYDTILDEQFNEKELLNIYYTLDNNKATFLDEISNELISLLIKNNPNQMIRLINLICSIDKIPKKLLLSRMASIQKKINAVRCDYLRGISIKSSLLSIIDKLILDRIWHS
ncbi:hypothetical protein RFI_31231 [Reticulomyxa filosa]|uniref:Uncharacterized protein n=1 Tax=Reticulomyxa filosa TaxID=46433 RepID=X6LW39_RETFI|nr:hypothetical protein RFI_31231 [Reticulomyxa filosa]|eukprot:ETO06168.1 hypothetical protein RFI_31231 [Reticulomyxa filosa]